MNFIDDDYERAVLSPCRTWRYVLRRRWSMRSGKTVAFVMLNPSTADESIDDPTIRRCISFAMRDPEAVGLVVGNLFAFRATKPEDLRAARDPIGPENDRYLTQIAHEAGNRIVCGWGEHGEFMARGRRVALMLNALGVETVCLGRNASGQPKHPLYIRADKQFEVWP